MIVDKSKQYVTRDNRPVVIYHIYQDSDQDYPVHGAVKEYDGWDQRCWRLDGAYIEGEVGCSDLKEAPKTYTVPELWAVFEPDTDKVTYRTTNPNVLDKKYVVIYRPPETFTSEGVKV